MRTTEFNQQPTAAKLNESMFKKFGSRINFEKYTREQLEDYRNLLRTKVDQTESQAGFNDLLANENYQKDKYMLGVLNTKIKEMLGEGKKVDKFVANVKKSEKKAGKGEKKATDIAWATANKKGMLDNKNKKVSEACGPTCTCAKCKAKAMKEAAKPDFLDMDKDGDKKEPMKKAIKDKKVKEAAADVLPPVDKDAAAKRKANQAKLDAIADKRAEKGSSTTQSNTRKIAGKAYGGSAQKDDADLDEGKKMAKKAKPDFLDVDKDGNKSEPFKKAVKDKKAVKEGARRAHQYIIIESLRKFIAEDEEGKAKDITAGTDMVNDFTSWMQRVGQYQTKSMIELADSIRANFGQAEADAFKAAITPALQEALAALTQSRESITRAVAVLAGEEAAQNPMGAETPDLTGDAGMEDPLAPAGDDTMNAPAGDEFGASDAAAGGEEASGRGMRESRAFNRAKKLAESHSIMSKLAR